MKKAFLLLTALCLALTATACTRPSNQHYYEEAQLYLGSGDCERAAGLFSRLGEYADSADYAMYCAGLHALQEGDYELARANLNAIHPFKSSERYLRFLDALEAEDAGELEEALSIYTELGSFEGSATAAAQLRKTIPESAFQEARRLMIAGEYEKAREQFLSLEGYGQSKLFADNCTRAIQQSAYSEADDLFQSGDHLAAMQAFLALGDVLDAPARAAQCREAIVSTLDLAAQTVTLDTAGELIDAYTAIGDEAALTAAAQLSERFGVNLQVLEKAPEQPYVLLGSYPTGESGLESELMWRVIKAEGDVLTLLCTSVIDASPIATVTDLTLSEAESAAATAPMLPAMADLSALSDLTCTATPYAVAQGVPLEGGLALYWLRDSLESGLHPIVKGDGSLALPEDSAVPGVRPMMTLSLEDFTFTAGSGTQEDPFR